MIEITGRITKKPDGSYLIDQGRGPCTYHAHQTATPEQWQAAEDYATEHPDMVDEWIEPDYARITRIGAIKRRLEAIDREAIRPMRAALAGTATLYDTDKLADLEQEVDELRAELSTMGES
jgi:hypothetical protein